MFRNNNIYNEGFHSHNTDIQGNQVVLYPENMLPTINVVSDFGDCEVVTSDIYDLFNQQRLSNLGPDVIRDFIARNYPLSSPISEEISRMSDEQIMDSIKPRNIQSYSELMSWSKYLNARIENALKEVQEGNDASVSTSEPSPQSDSQTSTSE